MRVFGAIIFTTGFFLCFTIILAGLGLFLMFIGLILMIVGGGRRKVFINNVVNVNSPPPEAARKEPRAPLFSFGKKERREPVIEAPSHFALPAPSYERELRTINPEPYDRARWNALVEYDPDISRVANALSPYGQKYIDQFAKAYLALNDKEYLPMIVQKILVTAREDASRRSQTY